MEVAGVVEDALDVLGGQLVLERPLQHAGVAGRGRIVRAQYAPDLQPPGLAPCAAAALPLLLPPVVVAAAAVRVPVVAPLLAAGCMLPLVRRAVLQGPALGHALCAATGTQGG